MLPAWLNVMMDDIEEEKMYTKKGKEPEANESNEEVPSWSGEPCDMERSKEEASFDEQENEGSNKEEEKSNRKSNKSSSSFCFGDTPNFELPKPKDSNKENLLIQTKNPLVETNALHSMDTFGGFAMMALNIDVKNDEVKS